MVVSCAMMPPLHSLPAPHLSSENSPSQIATLFAGVHLGSTLQHLSSDYHRLLLCSQSQLRSKMQELKSGSIFMWNNMCSRKCLIFGKVQPGWSPPELSLFSRKGFDREGGFLSSIESLFKNIQRDSSNKRFWTDVLLGANALTYAVQVASRGRLVLWGAKVNSLIREGQIWRLATSSFLHANILHLMVGAYAVFIWRNRSRIRNGEKQLERIGYVVALNMVIGLTTKGIDNWGHLGGLLGGAAVALFLNPS